MLRLSSGEERAGDDLRKLVEEARAIRNLLRGLHSRYNRQVVEQAAILGVLNARHFRRSGRRPMAAAPYIARRLDALADETERGWQGQFTEGAGFQFERTVRGVKEVADHRPGAARLGRRAQARRIRGVAAGGLSAPDAAGDAAAQGRGHADPRSGQPVRGGDRGRPQGRLAAALQGPRRDEPEQLWETTLDTNARSLLQVNVKEIDEANTIFDELMGDKVEPRRVFIEENALTASVDV